MNQLNITYSEDQRITDRGEDFMITSIKPVPGGNYLLQARGLSELSKDKVYTFDTFLDDDIRAVKATEFKFVPDSIANNDFTRLFIETALRSNPRWNNKTPYTLCDRIDDYRRAWAHFSHLLTE